MKKGTQKVEITQKNKLMDPADIKKEFIKLSNGKQVMTDDQLFHFLGQVLKIDGQDPIVGHIMTNIMAIKKIEQTKYDNFENLIKYTKAIDLKDLKNIIQQKQFIGQLSKGDNYKQMYRKLFELYSGKFTTLDYEVAESLWGVYLKGKMNYYKQFIDFVSNNPDKSKIYKDTWNMVFEFGTQVKDITKEYNQTDGWPAFIDKFVDYIKTKKFS